MCYIDRDVVIVFYIYLFMVILRSITGPYGRPIVEVAYGEILISLHRGCMGVKLEKSGWGVAHVGHTRVNTSVGSLISFWIFIL